MGLETATYILDFNAANPPGSDPKSQGDDHVRLIKNVLRSTFPTANRAFALSNWSEKTSSLLDRTSAYSLDVATDNGKTFRFVIAAPTPVNLPAASLAKDGWNCWIQNFSDWPLVLQPTGADTIEGQVNLIIHQNEGGYLITDGSHWSFIGKHGLNAGVGSLVPGLASQPENTLWLNGQIVSRARYPRLFARWSTYFGVGDGSTTFQLADMTGRTFSGRDAGSGRLTSIADTIGAIGGTEKHQLTLAELPSFSVTAARIQLGGFLINGGGGVNILEQTYSFGSNTPHNILQPTMVGDWYVRY